MPVDMHLHIVASLLRRGRSLDQLSTGLTLLGVFVGLGHIWLPSMGPWSLVLCAWLVITGLGQKYWAFRVGFDADLFQLLARDADQIPIRTQALDLALQQLGLQPAERGGRAWTDRAKGALSLLRRQALWLAAQLIPTVSVILASPWLPFAG